MENLQSNLESLSSQEIVEQSDIHGSRSPQVTAMESRATYQTPRLTVHGSFARKTLQDISGPA